jgi:hypothetical protein
VTPFIRPTMPGEPFRHNSRILGLQAQ